VIDHLLAALVLVTCIVMLGRMALGERRRRRLDAQFQVAADAVRHFVQRLLRRGPSRADAERAARDAIRRARERRNKLH
jgi:hypothetical protein